MKYGLIRLIKQEADLCEQIQNVDMHCPLKQGKMTLTKEVDIPKEVPPVSIPFVNPWIWAVFTDVLLQ